MLTTRKPMKRSPMASAQAQPGEYQANREQRLSNRALTAIKSAAAARVQKSLSNAVRVQSVRPQVAIKIEAVAPASGPIVKARPVRSEPYRRAVASLPCVICKVPGYSQAAHGSEGKGMGIKACDSTLFPACCDRPGVRGCHGQLDQGALFTKAARRLLEVTWAADTQRRVHAMGLWPKDLPAFASEEGEIA